MKDLFLPILKTIFQRRDTKIFLTFSSLPLLSPFLMGNASVETLYRSSLDGNFLEYLEVMLSTQLKLILPILALIYVIYSIFKEEFETGTLFLYKDISRKNIFQAKVLGILSLYLTYFGLSSLASVVSFLLFTDGHRFLPQAATHLQEISLSLSSTILLNLVVIALVILISIKKTLALAVCGGIGYVLTAMVAPHFTLVQYLFPNSYVNHINTMGYITALLMMIGISFTYLGLLYHVSRKNYQTLEF